VSFQSPQAALAARRADRARRCFAALANRRPSRFAFGVVPFLARSLAATRSFLDHSAIFSACLALLVTDL